MVIFVCVGAALSAQMNFSAGGGLLFDTNFRGGVNYTYPQSYRNANEYWVNYAGGRTLAVGAFGFLDATFAELSVNFARGFNRGVTRYNKSLPASDQQELDKALDEGKTSHMQLGFQLLGKFPIDLGGMIVYPLAGASYTTYFAGRLRSNGSEIKDYGKDASQFGILGGAGLDFPLGGNMFIRAQGLLEARFASKAMRDAKKLFDEEQEKIQPASERSERSNTLSIGPTIKIGIGFLF